MRLRYIIITGSVIGTALTINALADATKSSGAEPHVTGAPGETTCARSGCHASFGLNSGPGIVTVTVDNGEVTTYTPGQTYRITVRNEQSTARNFGFQATVLNANNKGAGTITLLDTIRTKFHPPQNAAMMDRRYVEQTSAGTAPLTTGVGQWGFNWKAPAQNQGAITIYVASIGGNKSASDTGDYVYTKQITLQPASVNGVSGGDQPVAVKVYPNPATATDGRVTVSTGDRVAESVELVDPCGRVVATVTPTSVQNVISTAGNPAGAYFMRVRFAGGSIITRPVIIR